MKILRILAATLALAAAPALAGSVSGKDYEIVTLAPGVHGFVWSDPSAQLIEGNSLFIVNDSDVVVVDTGLLPASTRRMAEELRRITDKPVRIVVNTHWHDDHVNGNGIYRELWPGAQVVAHSHTRSDHIEQTIEPRPENVKRIEGIIETLGRWLEKGADDTGKAIDEARRARIVRYLATIKEGLPGIAGVKDHPADLTFEDKLVLHRGARTIEILHLGLGNTRGDAVVFLPRERIVATGDLLVWPVPFMFGSYYDTWPETLERLAALPADTFFLMHGAPQKNREYLNQVQGLLREITAQARVAAATDLPADEAAKRVDLKAWEAKFTRGDVQLARDFQGYVVQPALERAIRQARKEPAAFTQKLR